MIRRPGPTSCASTTRCCASAATRSFGSTASSLLAEVAGVPAALGELEALEAGPALLSFLPYQALRADLLLRAGRSEEAANAYRAALTLGPGPRSDLVTAQARGSGATRHEAYLGPAVAVALAFAFGLFGGALAILAAAEIGSKRLRQALLPVRSAMGRPKPLRWRGARRLDRAEGSSHSAASAPGPVVAGQRIRCRSSVVERILGKAEVGSSILPGSTIRPLLCAGAAGPQSGDGAASAAT